MVWSKIDPSDGKPRYIRVSAGNRISLTREKSGKLADEIPDGWAVREVNGHLKLRRTR